MIPFLKSPILIVTICSLYFIRDVNGYQVGNNPRRRAEIIDPGGRYLLEWEVDQENQTIIFNVTVETKGWIGLGFSNDGTSSGADMVIGEVGPNGKAYLSDRHMLRDSNVAVLDRQQDYTLLTARETGTHTSFRFSRAIDTCDPEDYSITLNQINLLWAYGEDDIEIGFNPAKSGTFGVYLLDPEYAPEIVRDRNGTPKLITQTRNENIPRDTKAWSVSISRTLPANETTYMCSIHKAPRLQRKHHFIGYDIDFGNDESRQRTHHMLMYRCKPPRGFSSKEVFEPHISNPGQPCYRLRVPKSEDQIPVHLCSELYTLWAVGGREMFYPDHVGTGFGEETEEYYLIELHYDNPLMERPQVDVRFDFFYTSQLRPNEGGVMGVNHEIPGNPESLLIPPNSVDHRIFGHCSSECTRRMYPQSGIKAYAVMLHGHSAAVGLRLRHFRGGRELPWILYDDNYNNQLQPVRPLNKEIRIMPGDQLTVDCHYSNNDTTTVGGFSSKQEMCVAFLLHYERVQDYSFCSSEIYSPPARQEFLGIQNITWIQEALEWVAQTPAHLAGLTVSEVSNRYINWTPERRRRLKSFHETEIHSGGCHKDISARYSAQLTASPNPAPIASSQVLNTPDDYRGPVSYPFNAIPYRLPGRSCPSWSA